MERPAFTSLYPVQTPSPIGTESDESSLHPSISSHILETYHAGAASRAHSITSTDFIPIDDWESGRNKGEKDFDIQIGQ